MILSAEPAFAASGAGGPSDVVFFVQILVLLFAGRLLGEAAQRVGQPAVMGQLIAGLLLGPSVLGALWPELQHAIFPPNPGQKSMIDAVSQLGILLLLLLTGMETDLKLVRRAGRAATSVSMTGVAVPFVCGFLLGQFIPDSLLPDPAQRTVASLFLGTALSISSVKIVAMVVREMNFMRRNLGQVIVASAIIDDTIGWVIIAITFSLASHGTLDATSLAKAVVGTLLFLIVSLTVGRRAVFTLIRWANDSMISEAGVISVIVLLMVAMALLTQGIGVHTVLGAFVAGILVGESPILTKQIEQQIRGLIAGLFMPIFFAMAGLSADLSILKDPTLLLLTLGLIAIASFGKFGGAFLGAEFGGLSKREALALAFGMNARGSTEVIVATIGLSMGVLSQDLFTMIVAMAILTTLAMPPTLRWALGRLPLSEDESARLAREEFEAKGFLPNVERFLVSVDDSPNGRFAARVAGLIAGARGKPITVLHLGEEERTKKAAKEEQSPESAAKAGAAAVAEVEQQLDEAKPAKVDVTTRANVENPVDAVAEEARKGHDLMVIGLERTLDPKGTFDEKLAAVASGFDGPSLIVAGRGKHLERPESGFRILLPVSGTDVSRRAAEVAVALARANDVPITALYVSSAVEGQSRRTRASVSRRHEEEILKDVALLAERYDTEARTSVLVDGHPDEAILKVAKRGRHNLIVMGVHRRPGETMFFGNVVLSVLQKSDASVLLVS
ncbi:MAG: cation:proton antiporter [Rhodospirillaceae bacterium]|nr:cation:proton antiporter [Rhodospirillaceae bacterium]